MSNFQDPPPPCPSTSKIFQTPWLWTSNFKGTATPPSLTNYGATIALCTWTNQIKTKAKPNWPHAIVWLAHIQCDRIIKGCLHCLTPESINNCLSKMSGHGANSILLNTIKRLGRPEHSTLLPSFHRSDISYVRFTEIAIRHECSPVNLLHIFRAPFPENTSG